MSYNFSNRGESHNNSLAAIHPVENVAEHHHFGSPSISFLEESMTSPTKRENIDFSVPEIQTLKELMRKQETFEIKKLFNENPQLTTVPLYRLFGIYLSIWYENEEIFDILKRKHDSEQDKSETKIDKEASFMVSKHTFSDFQSDLDECRSKFSELIIYRALDFNVRDIFRHGFENNLQIRLRRSDVLTLLNYKHYQEIELTFNKVIKKNILSLFFDAQAHLLQEGFFAKYCLAFYLDVMINEGFSDEEALNLLLKLEHHLDIEAVVNVFIRHNKLALFNWGERSEGFAFKQSHLGLAINYEAFDIAMYMLQAYWTQIKNDHSNIPEYLLQSCIRSNQFWAVKTLMIHEFFKAFTVEEFDRLLDIFDKKYNSPNNMDNPFLFSANVFGLSILQIKLLRNIQMKYKSLQVKCQSLEQYLEESTLSYLDLLTDVEHVFAMLLGQSLPGIHFLQMLGELELYRLIQHRHVQEVIMTIHHSEYSIECMPIDNFSVFRMMTKEDMFQLKDFEHDYRFYNCQMDLKNMKQNSLMLHIWKKSSYVRYNMEFFTLVMFALLTEIAIVLFLTNTQSMLLEMQIIKHFGKNKLEEINPFYISMITYSCTQSLEHIPATFYCVRIVETCLVAQSLFLLKFAAESWFLKLTKRKGTRLTEVNVIMLLLGLLGVVYIIYLLFYQQEPEGDADTCQQFSNLNQKQYDQYAYLDQMLQSVEFIQYIYSLEVILMFLLMLVLARMYDKLGTLLKIMFAMFKDFMKIMFIYSFMVLIFVFVGFTIFMMLKDFLDYNSAIQVLFNATLGNFSMKDFTTMTFNPAAIGLDTFFDTESFAQFYLICWLVLSNIMILNLMIALFSDTYNKLLQVGDGMYLIEIIETSPKKQYDKFYSGLISCPFPFAIIIMPLFPIYAFVRNEKFNEFILKLSHIITMLLILIPVTFIVIPLTLPISYIKCCINKLFLILNNRMRHDRLNRIVNFAIFLIFGLIILLFDTFVDIGKQFYIQLKPESMLRLRNQKTSSNLDLDCFDRIVNIFMNNEQENPELGKRLQLIQRLKLPTKEVIKNFREQMKVQLLCQQVLLGSSNLEEIFSQLQQYKQIKQFIIENSIRESNKDLFIYPSMIQSMLKNITLIIEVQYSSKQLKKKRNQIAVKSCILQRESETKRKILVDLMLQANISIAQQAYVRDKKMEKEEEHAKIANETIDRTIKYLEQKLKVKW